MTVLLTILLLLLSILYLHERSRNKSIHQELIYIRERICVLSNTNENGYLLVPSENTEIKALAAELNRLLDAFRLQKADYAHAKQAMIEVLTNISHDLRTPLTVLKGCCELLYRETQSCPVSPTVQAMITKIDLKADELTAAINAYFTMSKIESGDISIQLQQTNITQICHEIILDYYDILEKEQYTVNIQIPPEPVFAYTDVEALHRILKNLIDNAIKYGNGGKYLGICLEETDHAITIKIEDHGQGIASRDLDLIFSRNYTTAHHGTGSGLGLTIAKNLSLRMGADILVSSRPWQKTVFTLVFNR